MKIHLKQIPAAGLHLAGDEECPLQDVPEVRCLGPLQYDLNVGVSEGGLWAQGSLAQKVELQCVGCLGRFAHEIRVPEFALHTDLRGPETVDITPFLREDILLNVPSYPRCDRDGTNVCRGAKQRELAEPSSSREADEKRQHDWGALDQLKVRR